MTKCHNHPDREARVVCQKIGFRGYCQECLDQGASCFDPSIYCKFRGQCLIRELARENGVNRQGQGLDRVSLPEQRQASSAGR